MTPTQRLERIVADLDAVTNDLEERGFEAQATALDEAAEKIEDVANAFEPL